MAVFNNILAGASGATGAAGYEITRSLRFNSADSANLSRTFSSAGNRKTWTWSGWFKRAKLGTVQGLFNAITTPGSNSNRLTAFINTNDKLYIIEDISGGTNYWAVPDQVFRDVSAWYHLVFAFDTTLSTGADRVKVYVNGNQVTSFALKETITQNQDTFVNSTIAHNIGLENSSDYPSKYWDGYLADVHFIDGQQLAASDFGEYDDNNVWQPIEYTGTYGTNGFHLDFSDNSSNAALGTDSSGNSNTWTVNNLNASANYSGVSFDGSGDRLTVADDADLAFGTGEFTVEMYFIADTVTGNDVLYDSRAGTGNTTDGFSIVRNGNLLRTYTSGNYAVTSSTTLSTGQLYHLAVTREGTTQKMYLDGTLVGSATVNNNFSQQKATIGSDVNGDESWDGFISNVRLVKGTAVYTANFTVPTAPLTNVTNTVLLCCQSSTSVTAATVAPGTITAHGNVSVMLIGAEDIDSLIDTPTNYDDGTNVGGNYATFNPLHLGNSSNAGVANSASLSDGNLRSLGAASKWAGAISTMPVPNSGKWYFEFTCLGSNSNFGLFKPVYALDGTIRTSTDSKSVWYGFNGVVYYYVSSTVTDSSAPATYTTNDVIGIAVDSDAYTVKYYKNNSLQYTQTLVSALQTELDAGNLFPGVDTYSGTNAIVNFGQRPFAYTPPTGYVSLCTTNLPDPTIADGSTAFDVNVWNGDGTSNRLIPTNFSPDFTWMKIISQSGQWHLLADSVRGGNKTLSTNNTNAEVTRTGFVSFDSNGFTIGDGNSNPSGGQTLVGFAWDAGTSTVSNTDGSITSSVRANPSAGFSIVSYTGNGSTSPYPTIGHGLNAVPKLIITKSRDSSANWTTYTTAIDGTLDFLYLNTTGAAGNSSLPTPPDSSIFQVGGSTNNANGDNCIAYCFAPVEGYSAFGSYTGNGLADGPFVYTGFRPRFLLWKPITGSTDWVLVDSARSTYNVLDKYLLPNTAGAEGTLTLLDFCSNGFKLRTSTTGNNTSGTDVVWAAFAEHPFKTARAR